MQTTSSINIEDINSVGIRAQARRDGIKSVAILAESENVTVYQYGDVRVADTNGDPIWEESDPIGFADILKEIGVSLIPIHKPQIAETEGDLTAFEPVRGTYGLDMTAIEMEGVSAADVEFAIARQLADRHGFDVAVEVFHRDGRAIMGETPSAGNFVATRK